MGTSGTKNKASKNFGISFHISKLFLFKDRFNKKRAQLRKESFSMESVVR